MKITINTDKNLRRKYDLGRNFSNEELRSMIGEASPTGGRITSIEYDKTWKVMGATFRGKEVIK